MGARASMSPLAWRGPLPGKFDKSLDSICPGGGREFGDPIDRWKFRTTFLPQKPIPTTATAGFAPLLERSCIFPPSSWNKLNLRIGFSCGRFSYITLISIPLEKS